MSSSLAAPRPSLALFEAHKLSLGLLAIAFLVMYVPAYFSLSQGAWGTDSNGHGPIILGLVFWLLWTDREEILKASSGASPYWGLIWIVLGAMAYVLGRSQGIDTIEVGSQLPILIGCLLLIGGAGALRKAWFPIFFLCFMVPLPGVLTQMITLPLKAAVSYVSEGLLYWAGYPIGRAGVTLVIGPYQLLVADACSGLNSIFTLEALGLFYMKLMNYTSRSRNIFLALMIIPISFISNVTRVICLILITYYFGDQVGQGFMHGFAGMLLFGVALILIFGLDAILSKFFDKPAEKLTQSEA
jgi:exosortase B